MNLKYLLAGLGLIAAPASAEILHETSVVHNDQNISLRYEKKAETVFRQTGAGPRAMPMCFWKTKLTVQRTATGANGQTIPALSGMIQDAQTKSGAIAGMCNAVKASQTRGFGENDPALRTALSDAASSDALSLRDSLAKLALAGSGPGQQ